MNIKSKLNHRKNDSNSANKARSTDSKQKSSDASSVDRKVLADQARQLKMELFAMRLNLQTPSVSEYRKKKFELVSLLSKLA